MSSGPPFMADFTGVYGQTVQPSTVHVTNTGLARFFSKYLYERLTSQFVWKLPERWPLNYFTQVLYLIGYIAIINTDKFGVIPQWCSLRGYDVFYQPKEVVVTNPLIDQTETPVIGKDCELIRLTPTYTGVWDIVSYYADQMALVAQSFGVNALNSRLSYVFLTDNERSAESIKKMYDIVAAGNPAVVADRNLFDRGRGVEKIALHMLDNGSKEKLSDFLLVLRELETMFDRLVGIPNIASVKRERQITGELEANADNTQALAFVWMDELKRSTEKANKMFNLKISVDWRYNYNDSDNDDTGNVSRQSTSIGRVDRSERD